MQFLTSRNRPAAPFAALSAFLCTLLYISAQPARAVGPVVVTPSSLQGWYSEDVGAATSSFVTGPATPPLGSGSLQWNVGANGDDYAKVRNDGFSGVRLDSITTLTYKAFVQQHVDSQAPFLVLNLDLTGDGKADDQIFFEPAYQSAAYFPSNPQGPLVVGAWQTWDALHGAWWSNNGVAGAEPGDGVKSIAQILAAAPNATIVNVNQGPPDDPNRSGVYFESGNGAPSWDSFVGNVDDFTISSSAGTTTYDFESCTPSTSTVVVDPDHANHWSATTAGGAASSLVIGPGTPPLGSGSDRLTVDADGDDFVIEGNDQYAGVALADLQTLSYSTFVSHNLGDQAPYLSFRVSWTGDGTFSDKIYFEPAYQNGSYSGDAIPHQPTVALNTWQTWDALHGGWWSANDSSGQVGNGGPPVITLDHYLALHPGAKITNDGGVGVRMIAGGGAGSWDNFDGNFDNLTIAADCVGTTYDFEGCVPVITTAVVDPTHSQGWVPFTTPNTSLTYVSGPATPPVGVGSLQLAVGPASADTDGAEIDNFSYDGLPLASLTHLKYSTYIQQYQDGQAPYLFLGLDPDGTHTTTDYLVFEPVYQTGAYSGDAVPNQGNVTLNTWQTWDALHGGWWTNGGGPPLITLAHYLADHPNAVLRADNVNQYGAIIMAAGYGAGAWDNFVGNADNLTIGEECSGTRYDFEPTLNTYYLDHDGDGHGDAAHSIQAASPPAGYVTNSDDCDDSDATVYPGAPEICDGKDNNCDGHIDEGVGSAQTLIVDPTHANGWAVVQQRTATSGFVIGPGTPPLGYGSFHAATGAGNSGPDLPQGGAGQGGKVYFGNSGYTGTPLASVSAMGYSTYVAPSSTAGASIATDIVLQVDVDGNGSRDSGLVFEPVYSPEQGAIAKGVWQTWDARHGKWYFSKQAGAQSVFSTSSYITWDQIVAAYPNAKILNWYNAPDGAGVALVTGQDAAGAPWAGFDGNADAFHLTAQCDATTYDFEAAANTYYRDADGDGYGDINNSIQSHSPTPPSGYVTDDTDCNDNDPTVHATTVSTVTVKPSSLNDWSYVTENTGSGAFVYGPSTPPLGVGSFNLKTGSGDGAGLGGKIYLGNPDYNNVPFTAISAMSYNTFITSTSGQPGAQNLAPTITLQVDVDGDGVRDSALVFEPIYSTDQGTITPGLWQHWDARNGHWWFTKQGSGSGAGQSQTVYGPSSYLTFAQILATYPNIKLVNWFSGADGSAVALTVGQSSGGFWKNFDGNVDGFSITALCTGKTFDFEPEADTTAPVITGLSASPSALSPPDHRLVPVTLTYSVSDASPVTNTVTAVSNQLDQTGLPGDQTGDISIIDSHHLLLRAEEEPIPGRVYTITVTSQDAAGNSSSQSVTVAVNHGAVGAAGGPWGDVDEDGAVTLLDAALVTDYLNGLPQSDAQKERIRRYGDIAGTVNHTTIGNNVIDKNDVQRHLYIAGGTLDPGTAGPDTPGYGDVTGDGQSSLLDAVITARSLNGLGSAAQNSAVHTRGQGDISPTVPYITFGDGAITTADVNAIIARATGTEANPPAYTDYWPLHSNNPSLPGAPTVTTDFLVVHDLSGTSGDSSHNTTYTTQPVTELNGYTVTQVLGTDNSYAGVFKGMDGTLYAMYVQYPLAFGNRRITFSSPIKVLDIAAATSGSGTWSGQVAATSPDLGDRIAPYTGTIVSKGDDYTPSAGAFPSGTPKSTWSGTVTVRLDVALIERVNPDNLPMQQAFFFDFTPFIGPVGRGQAALRGAPARTNDRPNLVSTEEDVRGIDYTMNTP